MKPHPKVGDIIQYYPDRSDDDDNKRYGKILQICDGKTPDGKKDYIMWCYWDYTKEQAKNYKPHPNFDHTKNFDTDILLLRFFNLCWKYVPRGNINWRKRLQQ